MYLNFRIKVPNIIANLVLWFLLRHREKHKGFAFRRIKLTKGGPVGSKQREDRFALVDAEDYRKLSEYDWQYVQNKGGNHYGARIEGGKIVYMHRQIMNAPKGSIIDHKDREGLNNTKNNLRFVTFAENNRNRRRVKGVSKYRGVSRIKNRNKWQASITYNYRRIYLGHFDNQEDAAKAYDQAAMLYHGDFAVLNFSQVSAKPSTFSETSPNGGLAKTDPDKKIQVKKNQKARFCVLDDIILVYIIIYLYIFTGINGVNMIKIKELRKSFGPIVAVDGVSFEVEKGQVLGFLGPNGAGKSTVMRMLACFLRPDSGTASVCGFDIIKNPIQVRQNIGYLAENVPAYSDMTAGAFLNFICDARGLQGKRRKEALDKAVAMCHIESVYHQTIETLSKGYKRRVGLAQALIHDPQVLILDEPTDGLDPNQKHEVRGLIEKMAKEKCIVISTHILEEVEAICSRAIVIARGKILVDSTPDKLKTEHNCSLEEVFRKITSHKVA
ncbi:MAG: ATP-binding cassette domain-containing protein [Planctomycetes bacterium]|nr:ATP-binding cassette domain-containing protein [Planctomycetota bacterium]